MNVPIAVLKHAGLFASALLLIASLSWSGTAAAAACSQFDYVLTTQAEVDALGATGCDSVSGFLWIRDSTDITNLDALANLNSVESYLNIANNAALTNINGLASLTSVGEYLNIDNNDTLTNLDGLANLSSVGSSLLISQNDTLTNLDGLSNISGSVEGRLLISENDTLTNLDGLSNISGSVRDDISIGGAALTSLDGLAGITSVGGGLSIGGNATLTSLDGLAGITSVGGGLWILSNTALTNVDGLANLASVGGQLQMYGNSALTNVDGLANLTSVGRFVYIVSNRNLTSLNGLANLRSVGEYLWIRFNQNATQCEGLAPLVGWPVGPPDDSVAEGITVGSNGTGCNGIEQILASVSGPTSPSISSAVATGDGGIALEFSSSTTTDTLFPITGYEATCTGSVANPSEAPAAALLDNTPISRTLTVFGYDPVSVLSDIEVDIDITHSDPTDLYITLTSPEGTELVLWNQGSSGGEDIVGTFPTTLTPVDSLNSVNRQTMDGDWVLSIEDIDVGPLVREGVLNSWGLRITEELARSGSGSPIEVFGVTRGRDYSCTVAPVTGLGTLPVSDAVSAKSDFPTAPSISSTDYEDGTIRLTVSVADNGGADITEYAATCTDGTNAFTGTSSTPTIEVTGLTNGTAYTCTASATNAVGTSGTSAPTESITPEEPSAGLPIWLLYEATK